MVEYCLHITVVPNECLTALFSHLFQNPSVLIFEVSAFHVSVRNKISKISDSFSVGIFFLPGFSAPYRHPGDSKGSGILLYVQEDIPFNR